MQGNIQVRAVPTSDAQLMYTVECSECGPVGVVIRKETDETCIVHLESHGVNVAPWRVQSTEPEEVQE